MNYMWDDSPTRVAFYIRVSTEEQKKDGYGAEMQIQWLQDMMIYREKISGWVHKKEWLYQDLWCTGADMNRPALKRMMDDAKAGKFDMIAVWKIDRFSRNLSHLLGAFEMLQKNKVGFFSLKENIDFSGPIGKLTFQIFGALAEFERETIKTRTKEGKMTSARLGNYVLNHTPFGYKKEGGEKKRGRSLEIVEKEALWVKRIFNEFLQWRNLEQIAKILNESKVLKNEANLNKDRATKWYGNTIRALLENTAYTWRAVYNSKDDKGNIEVIEIPVPRIISDLSFELAQNRLKSIDSDSKRGGGDTQYLLSRKIVDIETGRKFIWVKRTKGGINYRRKGFSLDGVTYKNRDIPGDPIEKHVWETIHQMIYRPGELFDIFKRQSIDSGEYNDLMKELERSSREIEKLDNNENAIELDYYSGKHSEEKKDKLIQHITKEKNTLINRVEELNQKIDAIVRAEETKIALEKFTQDFDTSIDNLSFDQKKALIDLLVESIEVISQWANINLNIKLRFDQSRISGKQGKDEPKKLSSKRKTDTEEPLDDVYGATTSKGYFQMRLYSKMYKRQLGNRWKTYFDLLSRDEVQWVEWSRIFNSPKIEDFQVSTYLNHIEKHLDLSKQ